MWKKTLGLTVLAFVLSLPLQSCSSRYRNGYRGYAPAHVEAYGPSYGGSPL
jgi:hypothetical protein